MKADDSQARQRCLCACEQTVPKGAGTMQRMAYTQLAGATTLQLNQLTQVLTDLRDSLGKLSVAMSSRQTRR